MVIGPAQGQAERRAARVNDEAMLDARPTPVGRRNSPGSMRGSAWSGNG